MNVTSHKCVAFSYLLEGIQGSRWWHRLASLVSVSLHYLLSSPSNLTERGNLRKSREASSRIQGRLKGRSTRSIPHLLLLRAAALKSSSHRTLPLIINHLSILVLSGHLFRAKTHTYSHHSPRTHKLTDTNIQLSAALLLFTRHCSSWHTCPLN